MTTAGISLTDLCDYYNQFYLGKYVEIVILDIAIYHYIKLINISKFLIFYIQH